VTGHLWYSHFWLLREAYYQKEHLLVYQTRRLLVQAFSSTHPAQCHSPGFLPSPDIFFESKHMENVEVDGKSILPLLIPQLIGSVNLTTIGNVKFRGQMSLWQNNMKAG
jgi:hypothetical protein